MSKQNQGDGIRNRVRQFLGIRKGQTPGLVLDNPKSEDVVCSAEILFEIGKENKPLINRIRSLREIGEVVANRRLEENAVPAFCKAVEDLLHPSNLAEGRQAALEFLTAIVHGQYEQLGILRAHFFQVVKNHSVIEDFSQRLDLLITLSSNGKDLQYFEEGIGPFLLQWMAEMVQSARSKSFLELVINIVHFNSALLEEEVVADFVKEACKVLAASNDEHNTELCLKLLDAVIRYSSLPSTSLHTFIAALCCIVNVEKFCQPSWKLMRNLLGTHLGHCGIYTMCCILEDSNTITDIRLLRGAVFFIGMCLWGHQRVPSLKHSHVSVLPSLLQSLHCNNTVVAFEVILSIQRLVKKYGHELHIVAWDCILDIIKALQDLVENSTQTDNSLTENVHVLLSYIEELYEKDQYNGSVERFFDIVERWASKRPEPSLLLLVSYKAHALHPAKLNWITNLQTLLNKYFRYEIRTAVRVKVLDITSFVITTYSHWFEEELLEHVVLPQLAHIADDPDVCVRIRAVQMLVDIVQASESAKCLEILKLIDKVMRISLEIKKSPIKSPDQNADNEEAELEDVKTAVFGVVDIFQKKLYQLPQSHAIQAFELLISHMKFNFSKSYTSNTASQIRKKILSFFLSLRADTSHRIGLVSGKVEEDIHISQYFICDFSCAEDSRPSGMTVIPYSEAFAVILDTLKCETDWRVLEFVLNQLPEALQNKTLILCGQSNLNTLSSVLCKMVAVQSFLSNIKNCPSTVGRNGFHALIFPVLTVLATYHNYLERQRQFELIRTLESGLVTKCAKMCVSSLTLCLLEMQSVMISLLPTILLRLSQISATVVMAVPMLEFLSGLVRQPQLYTSFKANQYMSVFAICMPYTDPFRHSQYTVTLAYHVIAAWFVRCRIRFRKDFAHFITKGLKSSTVVPDRLSSQAVSQTGSRPRSSSRPETLSKAAASSQQNSRDEQSAEFHNEMLEICEDMMARYSFSQCLTEPRRTSAMDYLLSNGKSRNWLLGNMLITITTSAMASIGPDGLCAYCTRLASRSLSVVSTCSDTSETESMRSNSDVTAPDLSNMVEASKTADVQKTCTKSVVEEEQNEDDDSSSTTDTSTATQPGLEKSEVTFVLGNEADSKDSEKPLSGIPVTSSQGFLKAEDLLDPIQNPALKYFKIQRTSSDYDGDTAPATQHSHVRRHSFPLADNESIEQVSKESLLSGRKDARKEQEAKSEEKAEEPMQEENTKKSVKVPKQVKMCQCLCQGWAEVLIRRPTGNTSWVMRVQNRPKTTGTGFELGYSDASIALIDDPKIYECLIENIADDHEEKITKHMTIDKETVLIDLVQPTEAQDPAEGKEGKEVASVPTEPSSTQDLLCSPVEETLQKISYPLLDSSEPSTPTQATVDQSPTSFQYRSRLLSRSPNHGPDLFKMLEPSFQSSEVAESEQNEDDEDAEKFSAWGKRKMDFETPVLGASPLDGSPIKIIPVGDKAPMPRSYLSSADMYRLASESEVEEIKSPQETHTAEVVVVSSAGARGRTAQAFFPQFESSPEPKSPAKKKHDRPKSLNLESAKALSHTLEEPRSAHTPLSVRRSMDYQLLSLSGSASAEMTRKNMLKPVKPDSKREFQDLRKSPHGLENIAKDVPAKRPLRAMKSDSVSQSKSSSSLIRKPRGNTISHVTDAEHRKSGNYRQKLRKPSLEMFSKDKKRLFVDPNFIFLQLYHNSPFFRSNGERPIVLPDTEVLERAIKNLDRIPPCDTHKIGAVYVGPGQHDNEAAILRNVYGSTRYAQFLAGLGRLVRLKDCPPAEIYTGGLDRDGGDGEVAYSWQDDTTQVIFHVATLMPNRASDPACHGKKLHIGNDFVVIVYNDSSEKYKFGTIRGQFNFAEIEVKPLDNQSNAVTVRTKEEIKDAILHTGTRVISDENLGTLVRQMAIHINMIAVIHQSQKTPTDAYGCNWLERLRQIKRVRSRVQSDGQQPSPKDETLHFTGYI